MSSLFKILDSSIPGDRIQWITHWGGWPNREVQAHPAYGELFAQEGDQVLAATYVSAAGHNIIYPFLLRPITGAVGPRGLKDIVTPYGYGGPVTWGPQLLEAHSDEFWAQFDSWARAEHVVSEFIRYGLFNAEAVPYPGQKVVRQPNVVVTLDCSQESLWQSFESKVRRNVHRAQREDVRVKVDTGPQGLEVFHPIYQATMDRHAASAAYYFSADFFHSIHSEFPGQFAYFHALVNDKPVSTELVLMSAESVYFFLGGTLPEGYPMRSNEFLKFEVMKWAQQIGKQRYVLGGGLTAHDGLERYKRSFAPNGIQNFVTGQRILDATAYDSLATAKHGDEVPDTAFFPAYRA